MSITSIKSTVSTKLIPKEILKNKSNFEKQNLYERNKNLQNRKFEVIREISQSALKKALFKVISRMDDQSEMRNEYDLMMKNQKRYKNKIK